MAYIYILENKINGKKYVGQTVNLKARFYDYKNSKEIRAINNAIRKYGWGNFEKHYFIVPKSELDSFEVELIKRLNTLSPNGYNLDTGGHDRHELVIEIRQKISNSLKGRFAGKNHPMYGKCHPEEVLLKMSLAKKGKKISLDRKEKLAIYQAKGVEKIKRPIICLETNKKYHSITEASIACNMTITNLCNCLTKRSKTAGGYHWQYYLDNQESIA